MNPKPYSLQPKHTHIHAHARSHPNPHTDQEEADEEDGDIDFGMVLVSEDGARNSARPRISRQHLEHCKLQGSKRVVRAFVFSIMGGFCSQANHIIDYGWVLSNPAPIMGGFYWGRWGGCTLKNKNYILINQ